MSNRNSFGAASTLAAGGRSYEIFQLAALSRAGFDMKRIPVSIRILIENLLRFEDDLTVKKSDIEYVAKWDLKAAPQEINYRPSRVLLQDFTGVPCVVDLAAMRDALKKMGADPKLANPLIPVDLVIDHSVQVDNYGAKDSFDLNVLLEFQRNSERYALLRWAQTAFRNFRAVPPGTGIVHQVNLEYLAPVVFVNEEGETPRAYPDTLVGTDSHTTMINGLGVVGWGVGGIEAEACMLGQPMSMLLPEVIGFKLHGKLAAGATATDLVLMVTQMLRKRGVVGKFVEFFGPGMPALSLADRATIANMAPEYGATIGFFPVDVKTLDYMTLSNRPKHLVELAEAYYKEQGLFLEAGTPEPEFNDTLELDLASVEPSLAGPKRPQDRISLSGVKSNFLGTLTAKQKTVPVTMHGETADMPEGAVVIAAITSCTNTSNPSVMIGAGLLARKAVEKGLMSKPWVKTSLAPGSKVVTEYLKDSGLMPYLDALKFNLVGYGCTTCIGNSGPLPEPVSQAVADNNMVVAAVLSGNRNFEGRVNAQVRANYLASPPLVVAYALAGRVDIDLTSEPLDKGKNGEDVFLKDIWPSQEEVSAAVGEFVTAEQFQREYDSVFEGTDQWKSMKTPTGELFAWDANSTYIKHPPYFENMKDPSAPIADLSSLSALCMLGDSITTDHISPAGSFKKDSPAGKYLMSLGVAPQDFNGYGARRGNDEVMTRGTFANVRLKNEMLSGVEGGFTKHIPSGEQLSIYDASMKYQAEGTSLIVIAGKEYGSGSSRDWAAKGTNLLGVKAVIAESFERIHRSNLVGMGVLPCEFLPGESRQTLGLTGYEKFAISGVAAAVEGNKFAQATATAADGATKTFSVKVRIDTPVEASYFRNGGILPYVLRQIAKAPAKTAV
ncbi:MAG: aconitate hydratase AcnA [Acidobacteria bacterium]|nr:aconitate hydratase AcnA [Acidobacteriota bacterium]